MGLSLKERALQFEVSLPFMDGREKGKMKRLVDGTYTITDYGFLTDPKKKEDYVCFIVKEDSKNFYFGGQVLTDNMQSLEKEGYRGEIQKDGLPVAFGEKVSADKMNYVTVKFYPSEK